MNRQSFVVKKINGFKGNTICFYTFDNNFEPVLSSGSFGEIKIIAIYDFQTYVKFHNVKNRQQRVLIKKRFKSKAICYCCFVGESLVSEGWGMNLDRSFYIEETNTYLKKRDNSFMLFDFFTYPQFRKKGYYKKLLSYILSQNIEKEILIYALDSNEFSNRAIQKVGFEKVLLIKFNEIKRIRDDVKFRFSNPTISLLIFILRATFSKFRGIFIWV